MNIDNRHKARQAKNDLIIGILTNYVGFDKVKLLLKENRYTEACKKIDEHYNNKTK